MKLMPKIVESYLELDANKKCQLQGCKKPCYIENNGRVYDFCSKSHAQEYQKQQWEHSQKQHQQRYSHEKCKYPGCAKSCYSERGQAYDFCSRSHAELYKQHCMQRNPSHHYGSYGLRGTAFCYQPQWTNDTGPIYFYNKDEAYYDFTNFAAHCVTIDDKVWPTTEHYFQAQKFVGTPYEEVIRQLSFPREAFDFSRKPEVSYWRRGDWEQVKEDIMYKALLAKFTQHEFLNALLLSTKDRLLVEHTRNDSYWGDGGDGTGKNRLGSLLMKVRQTLRVPTIISPLPSPQYTATAIEMMQSRSPQHSDTNHDLMDIDGPANSPLTSPKAPYSKGPLMSSNDVAVDEILFKQNQNHDVIIVPSTATEPEILIMNVTTSASVIESTTTSSSSHSTSNNLWNSSLGQSIVNCTSNSAQLVGISSVSTSVVAIPTNSQVVVGTSAGVAMSQPSLVGTETSLQATSASGHEDSAMETQ